MPSNINNLNYKYIINRNTFWMNYKYVVTEILTYHYIILKEYVKENPVLSLLISYPYNNKRGDTITDMIIKMHNESKIMDSKIYFSLTMEYIKENLPDTYTGLMYLFNNIEEDKVITLEEFDNSINKTEVLDWLKKIDNKVKDDIDKLRKKLLYYYCCRFGDYISNLYDNENPYLDNKSYNFLLNSDYKKLKFYASKYIFNYICFNHDYDYTLIAREFTHTLFNILIANFTPSVRFIVNRLQFYSEFDIYRFPTFFKFIEVDFSDYKGFNEVNDNSNILIAPVFSYNKYNTIEDIKIFKNNDPIGSLINNANNVYIDIQDIKYKCNKMDDMLSELNYFLPDNKNEYKDLSYIFTYERNMITDDWLYDNPNLKFTSDD